MVIDALSKLLGTREPNVPICYRSGDPYASLVFINRLRASISPRMLTTNQLLVI